MAYSMQLARSIQEAQLLLCFRRVHQGINFLMASNVLYIFYWLEGACSYNMCNKALDVTNLSKRQQHYSNIDCCRWLSVYYVYSPTQYFQFHHSPGDKYATVVHSSYCNHSIRKKLFLHNKIKGYHVYIAHYKDKDVIYLNGPGTKVNIISLTVL